MIYDGKELDVSNSYEDFLCFIELVQYRFMPVNFESKERWLMYRQKVRDFQILMGASCHSVFLTEKEHNRLEQIKSTDAYDALEDIMDILRVYGTIRTLIIKKIKGNRNVKQASLCFCINQLKPEAKARIRALNKELKQMEMQDTLSRGEKIIRSHYIKAEIKDIKEGPNYYSGYRLCPAEAYIAYFPCIIYDAIKDESKLTKKQWEKTQENRRPQDEQSGHCAYDSIYGYENTLYVHGGVIKCLRDKHDVRSIRARVNSIYGSYTINATHCDDCKRNFISYKEWEYYTKFYGNMIADFRWVNKSGEFQDKLDLDLEHNRSLLYLCGYNVNASIGLQASERQKILKQIMDKGVLEKHEVINYLNYFITTNGNIQNHELARAKWKEDLAYVRDYNLQEQNEVEIYEVKKY